jgi:hypothetical protein
MILLLEHPTTQNSRVLFPFVLGRVDRVDRVNRISRVRRGDYVCDLIKTYVHVHGPLYGLRFEEL